MKNDELLKAVSDKIGEFFNEPIDNPCVYCEAAKAVLPIVTEENYRRLKSWAIGQRKVNSAELEKIKEEEPTNTQNQMVLYAKNRVLNSVISQCGKKSQELDSDEKPPEFEIKKDENYIYIVNTTTKEEVRCSRKITDKDILRGMELARKYGW